MITRINEIVLSNVFALPAITVKTNTGGEDRNMGTVRTQWWRITLKWGGGAFGTFNASRVRLARRKKSVNNQNIHL